MELLRQGPVTSVALYRRLAMKRQNVAHLLQRMIEQGFVAREPVPGQRYYQYRWVGGDQIPPDALRSWEDRAGRYGGTL